VGGTVYGDGVIATPAKGANLVESNNVVDVIVRVEDVIDDGEFLPQRLLAEIGAGVDEKADFISLQMDGRTGAAITRIGRKAHRTVAADDGDAHRGAGAEKSKFC
jgi:hypothetical protein